MLLSTIDTLFKLKKIPAKSDGTVLNKLDAISQKCRVTHKV